MNIEELKSKIRLMESLEDTLSTIASRIDTSASYLDLPSQKISEYYSIDGEPIDNNKLITIKNDLISKREYINNVIIPEIGNKVKSMNQEIVRIEEEERRRREEAERIERENRERQQREAAEASRRESEQKNTQTVVNVPKTVVSTPKKVSNTNNTRTSASANKMMRYISLK